MENKIRTYFIYTIGEIVLVVIGILIATTYQDLERRWKKQVSYAFQHLKTST